MSKNNIISINGRPSNFKELGDTLKKDALMATNIMSELVADGLQKITNRLMSQMDLQGHNLYNSKKAKRVRRPFSIDREIKIKNTRAGANVYIMNKVYHMLDKGTPKYVAPKPFPMIVPSEVERAYRSARKGWTLKTKPRFVSPDDVYDSIDRFRLTKVVDSSSVDLYRDTKAILNKVTKLKSALVFTRKRRGIPARNLTEKLAAAAKESARRVLDKAKSTKIADIEDPYYNWSLYMTKGRYKGKELNFVYIPDFKDIQVTVKKD